MAQSIGYRARARVRRAAAWEQTLTALKRRLLESLGFALLIACALMSLALLTYDPEIHLSTRRLTRHPTISSATAARY